MGRAECRGREPTAGDYMGGMAGLSGKVPKYPGGRFIGPRDVGRESTLVSEQATAADASAEIDRRSTAR